MPGLAGSLERAVTDGFVAQARQHGVELHKRAVQSRAADPVARELLATFGRQVKLYGARAQDCHNAGDKGQAVFWAREVERIIQNLDIVNAAIYS